MESSCNIIITYDAYRYEYNPNAYYKKVPTNILYYENNLYSTEYLQW